MDAKPKITKADMDGTPHCPHCDAWLFNATVTVEDLMEHYPFGGWLTIGSDGYAREGEHLTTNCQSCHKPVVLGFNSIPDEWHNWQIKCAAARTKADQKFIAEPRCTLTMEMF